MPRILIALLCLLLPAIGMADPVGRSIPYQKLYEMLAAVRQSDPQGIVVSSLQAQSSPEDQPLPGGLRIELRFGATRQPIALDHDGRFSLPLRADWAAGDAALWVNQPRSMVGISMSLTARLPQTTNTTYGRLLEGLSVTERIVEQQAGMMSFMVPKLQGMDLTYAGGTVQTAKVGSGASAKTLHSDSQGRLRLPFDSALPASTPVVLSALPVSLQPYAK
ncbi:MAG TPA: DUF2987 domain-containing protein [Xanthomonadaceae bacterium]|nr:DUF2987 domain-containing protein [Xanthomonadaceae bacterium]